MTTSVTGGSSRLGTAIREYATPPAHWTKPEQRMWLAVSWWFPLGAALHIVFIPLFLWLDRPGLAWFNILSAVIWLLAAVVGRQRRIAAAGTLSLGEASLFAALAVWQVGWGFGFQYFLLVLAPVGVPHVPVRPVLRWSWLGGIVGLLVVLYVASDASAWDGSEAVRDALGAINLISAFVIGTGIGHILARATVDAEDALEIEYRRSEDLLTNVLPEPIADRLKSREATIADGFSEASILFADIVDFTPLSEAMSPDELVGLLDDVFTRFDEVVARHGLEKIKTVGDAYMVAAGIPEPRPDHAAAIVRCAVDLRDALRDHNLAAAHELELRVGINSGPVVAGVIGRLRFLYDLWGDAVNTAARMESHGLAGHIQVTEATRALLDDGWAFTDRGVIDVKGKGPMRTFLLEGAPA